MTATASEGAQAACRIDPGRDGVWASQIEAGCISDLHKLRDAVEAEGIAIVAAGIARAIHQGAGVVVPRDIHGRTARLIKRLVGHEIAGDVRFGLDHVGGGEEGGLGEGITSQFIQEIFKVTIAVGRDEGAIGGIVD